VRSAIEKQKEGLFQDQSMLDAKPKPLISLVWDWVIILMVLYFVVSFVNSVVRNHLVSKIK